MAPKKVSERLIEDELIDKLKELKYVYRTDIRDRAGLESNFREKFQELNRVRLTDTEFQRLLDEIVTPEVFTAAQTLRKAFTRVSMQEIADNEYNLNISRYISTAEAEADIDLAAVHAELVAIEYEVRAATGKHNVFLRELGLSPLPFAEE